MSSVLPPEIEGKIHLPVHALDQPLEALGFEKKYGTSRIAYLGQGLTFKAPISDPEKAWRAYQDRIKLDKRAGTHYANKFLHNAEDEIGSLRYMVLRGYLQNIREARLSKALGKIAVPTYITVDGFLKVQEASLKHSEDHHIRSILEAVGPVLRGLAAETRTVLGAFLEVTPLENLSPLLGDLSVSESIPLNGFLNVQETAHPLSHLKDNDIRRILKNRIGTAGDVDPHSFHERRNYGWHQGQVKLLDYGGEKIGEIIRTHRDGIERALHDMMEQDANPSV